MRYASVAQGAGDRAAPKRSAVEPWLLANLAILAGVTGMVLLVSSLLNPWAEGEGVDAIRLGEGLGETLYYGIAIFWPLILAGSIPYLVLVWLSARRKGRYRRLIAVGLSPICVSVFYLLLYPGDALLLYDSLAIAAAFGCAVRLAPRAER